MTEIRPAPESAPLPVQAVAPALQPPAERPGLAGWLTTSDHKRIGRLYVVTSLLLGLVATGVGTVIAAEEVHTGFDLVDARTFLQLFTLHQEAAVWLFVVPLVLGLATLVVPLQVGSPEIAFPRGAATAYWAYVLGATLLLAAYITDGGPAGGTFAAVDLHLLALILVLVALTLGMICVVTTALTMRTTGMTMIRVPAFTWSMVVAGGLTLLSAPVLVAGLVFLFVTHHFGGGLRDQRLQHVVVGLHGAVVYLVAVPAAGTSLEIVPVLGHNPVRRHEAVLVLVACSGSSASAPGPRPRAPSTSSSTSPSAWSRSCPPWRSSGWWATRCGRPPGAALPLVFAVGSLVMLLAGAGAGALSAIDGLDLRGTTWIAAVFHLVVFGAAALGALGGLWWWAPKFFGRRLADGAGTSRSPPCSSGPSPSPSPTSSTACPRTCS